MRGFSFPLGRNVLCVNQNDASPAACACDSDSTRQVDDKDDYENGAEYAAADIHVGLL
jgi:hypothetical protein